MRKVRRRGLKHLAVEITARQTTVPPSPSALAERSFGYWWTLINDLRTSLKRHPLDVTLLRELLGEVA
jgi:hypothetical protein